MNDTDKLSTFKRKKRKEVLNYFKNLPEKYIIDICHELSCLNGKDKDPLVVYETFLTLINDRLWIETALSRKYRLSQEELDLANKIKRSRVSSKRKEKTSPVYDVVRKNYIWLINDLREEGLSWRQISLYLEMNHNICISYTYLRSIFLEGYSDKTDT
ncbi:MAG: hypothetical protein KKD44_17200 [Proteobacteria bacterium]|nr:hypothetical protein [Pseudomonadota bacterium]